jgi:hypothetical protein
MTIELTETQRQALQAESGKPVDVVDPTTQRRFVLLAQEQYERVRLLLEHAAEGAMMAECAVSPGILRSQQAFWRDLPDLLKTKKNHGKWVCYREDERIGIADSDEPLIRECLRRNIPDDGYDLFVIKPRTIPPWEAEEVEPLGPWHFEDDTPAS